MKKGRSSILNDKQFANLLQRILEHRHPQKNTLIIFISFTIGLKVHEIASLKIKDVAELNVQFPKGYRLKKTLILHNGHTTSLRGRSSGSQQRKRRSIRFTLDEFDNVVKKISNLTKAGINVNPENFYPEHLPKIATIRELPIEDKTLKNALSDYLSLRLSQTKILSEEDPLIISQKGGPYSANTLQEHVAMMLREWANIDHATSHSGRLTLVNELLNNQHEKLSTVQRILGHEDASTTTIYLAPTDAEEINQALMKAGKLNPR